MRVTVRVRVRLKVMGDEGNQMAKCQFVGIAQYLETRTFLTLPLTFNLTFGLTLTLVLATPLPRLYSGSAPALL